MKDKYTKYISLGWSVLISLKFLHTVESHKITAILSSN